MSYQVIARKWRPQTFEEVTGQEPITRTLRNAIEHGRLHHAYLFAGARGVGKTTTARLLAKALNCHKTAGPNIHPCSINDPEACASCREISESRSIDVLEFDAASHTGVQDIRDIILESINIAPARDRFRIFIIDEVHMLSTSSFNALLKTLEEPPSDVVFIMATTEPHKIPDTILSRCQEFEFRTIPLQKIFDRLKLIADAENIKVSEEALREIARSGQGSMRDAQSNFDQVISFSAEEIGVDDVTASLGIASVEMLTRVLNAVAARDARELLLIVEELITRGQDLRNFSRDLLGLFRDMLVYKVASADPRLHETAVLNSEQMAELTADFTEADLLRFYNSIADTESSLKEATQTRYALEMGLIKLIEMRRVSSIEEILKRLSAIESGGPGQHDSNDAPPAARSAAAEKKTLISESIEAPPPEAAVSSAGEVPAAPPDEPVNNFEADMAKFIESVPVRLPPISPEDLEHVEDNWLDNAFETSLILAGDSLKPIANASALIARFTAPSSNGAAQPAESAAPPAVLSMIDPELISGPAKNNGHEQRPPLPEHASEGELLAYAESHPTVRAALRIFRGKIIEIKRTKVRP